MPVGVRGPEYHLHIVDMALLLSSMSSGISTPRSAVRRNFTYHTLPWEVSPGEQHKIYLPLQGESPWTWGRAEQGLHWDEVGLPRVGGRAEGSSGLGTWHGRGPRFEMPPNEDPAPCPHLSHILCFAFFCLSFLVKVSLKKFKFVLMN